MKLWSKLFKRRQKAKESDYVEEEEWERVLLSRKDVDLHDGEQRDKYVRSCLEQINEASLELNQLKHEYGLVTSYLTDMEEIAALPVPEKAELTETAKKVVALEADRKVFQGKTGRMTDVQYRQMERVEEDMPQGYEDIKKSEEYQALIRQDLTRLDGERHAYYFRKDELTTAIENAKGMTIICIGAMAACILMLLVLQFGLQMDAQLGYLLTVAAGAIALTVIYVRHADAVKELKRVESGINKLILLQNRVKIRYVNNTNLLDYRYMKFGVNSANQLKYLWEQFLIEREERERLMQTSDELDFYHKLLIRFLRQYRIKDPNIWVHQAVALIDHKEMVEIRHNLILRRQKLRKQLDYNKEIAKAAQTEVKDLVTEYPAYAGEILARVSEYEKK